MTHVSPYGLCLQCWQPLEVARGRKYLECAGGHREQLIIKPWDVKTRDQQRCVMCGTAEGGIEAHHRLFASQGGLCEWANMITLCSPHHRWVTEERDRPLSEQLGVRISPYDRRHASLIPVVYHLLGAPVLLGTDRSVNIWDGEAA